MPRIKELHVNGAKKAIDADADRTLLSVLRDDLGLTGASTAAARAQCGACTVLLDGQPVRSCITRVGDRRRQADPHHRGPGRRRQAAPAPGGVPRRRRDAVRLLHAGHDHVGGRPAGSEAGPDPRRDRPRHERQHLPLRHLPPDRRRHRAGRQGDEGRWPMNRYLDLTILSSPNATSCRRAASRLRGDRRDFFRIAGGGRHRRLLLGDEAPAPAAAAARRRRRTAARSAPGCTSARTARSPSTPARSRSARTSARR